MFFPHVWKPVLADALIQYGFHEASIYEFVYDLFLAFHPLL